MKNKAASLPLLPGVYLMKDKNDQVIYVGKAKKLRNRVSQYFVDTVSHSPKTRLMVSNVAHFDVIIASSEFEALVLECSLIKQYMPKYNILLKDDKGYPYIRINMKDAYPMMSMVATKADDGAEYFGPFGSRGVTKNILDTIRTTLKLPGCNRSFPKDLGKGRPCLNCHMNVCEGWCNGIKTNDEYKQATELARDLLSGNYNKVSREIKDRMLEAAEQLNFELAASLRDQLSAIENLDKRQIVTAGSVADTDVFGYIQTDSKACYSVLHINDGNLVDKEYEILSPAETKECALESILKQYYHDAVALPKRILLPFEIDDRELIEKMFTEQKGRKVSVLVPQRGSNRQLADMAMTNAAQELDRITTKEENRQTVLKLLGGMLKIAVPRRIESFDISNISGTDNVASMVVYIDGKPCKKEYKKFKIDNLPGQDDYESMRQAVSRRFKRYQDGASGFSALPDLLLIDGGVTHASAAMQVLSDMKITIPVFGMVKDDRHRTRALVTHDGDQINIDIQQTVYALIGNIQEETHRFAINYHKRLRSNRLQYSVLDKIVGVGPKRKQDLLKHFKSLTAIKEATVPDLMRYVPADVANNVYRYFHSEEE